MFQHRDDKDENFDDDYDNDNDPNYNDGSDDDGNNDCRLQVIVQHDG